MSIERDARRAELLRRVEAAAGSARDHGADLADIIAAAHRGYDAAAGLGGAMDAAEALLADFTPGRHRDAA